MSAHNKLSQDTVNQWCDARYIKLLDNYKSNKTKHKWLCLIHDRVCEQTFDKIKQAGCLNCCSAEKRSKSNQQKALDFAKRYNMTIVDEFQGSQKNIGWRCNVHDKVYYKTFHVMVRLKDKRLPCCKEADGSITNEKGHRFFTLKEIQNLSNYLGYKFINNEYKGITHRHQWYCPKHNKTYTTTFQSLYNKNRPLRCCAGESRSGIRHPNYNPHIDDSQRIKDRRSDKHKQWSLSVRKRDRFRCQVCGHNQTCVAHHLDSYLAHPEKRYDVDNGVTLCRDCHKTFHRIYGHRKTTREQFHEFLAIHYWEPLI